MPPISSIYKIGNTFIPEPSSVKISLNPLHGEATGRTDDGIMHTELIDADKRKVEVSYDYLTETQLSAIIALVCVQYFTFTYPDPTGTKTIECYGPAVAAEPDIGVYYNGAWRNVTFSCIER